METGEESLEEVFGVGKLRLGRGVRFSHGVVGRFEGCHFCPFLSEGCFELYNVLVSLIDIGALVDSELSYLD